MKASRYSVSSAHPHFYLRVLVIMMRRHATTMFYSLLNTQISQSSSLGPKGQELTFETIQGNRKYMTKNPRHLMGNIFPLISPREREPGAHKLSEIRGAQPRPDSCSASACEGPCSVMTVWSGRLRQSSVKALSHLQLDCSLSRLWKIQHSYKSHEKGIRVTMGNSTWQRKAQQCAID